MRVFLFAAIVCFAVAVLCVVAPSALNTPAAAWGWGGLLSLTLDYAGARLPVHA